MCKGVMLWQCGSRYTITVLVQNGRVHTRQFILKVLRTEGIQVLQIYCLFYYLIAKTKASFFLLLFQKLLPRNGHLRIHIHRVCTRTNLSQPTTQHGWCLHSHHSQQTTVSRTTTTPRLYVCTRNSTVVAELLDPSLYKHFYLQKKISALFSDEYFKNGIIDLNYRKSKILYTYVEFRITDYTSSLN